MSELAAARRADTLTPGQQRLVGLFELFGFWQPRDPQRGVGRLTELCAAGDRAACVYMQAHRHDLAGLVDTCASGTAEACEWLVFHGVRGASDGRTVEALISNRLQTPDVNEAEHLRLSSLLFALQWDQPAKWQPLLTAPNPWLVRADQRFQARRDFYVQEIALRNCLSQPVTSSQGTLTAQINAAIGSCRPALSAYNQFTFLADCAAWSVAATSRKAAVYFHLALWLDTELERRRAAQSDLDGPFIYETSRTIKQLFEKGDKAYAKALRGAFECEEGLWAVLEADRYRKAFVSQSRVPGSGGSVDH